VSIKDFVSKELPKIPGPIYDLHGNYLWDHDGIQFYTIGQRHGFWGGGWVPLYIVAKNKIDNSLVVWLEDASELFSSELLAHERHRINELSILPHQVSCKIRYRQEDQEALLESLVDGTITIRFKNPQRAISSGQIVVAYDGDICIGSGIIA
jgi:tRNA-specific 2-thiouridylase